MNAIIEQQRDDEDQLFAADFHPRLGDGSFVAMINRSPLLREAATAIINMIEQGRPSGARVRP
jgi:hypothetical protein